MNTQHRSNREEGLEQLVEAMRSEDCGKLHASVKRKKKKVDEKHATAKCDHCDGTGNHGDKECKKCGGDGWIDAKDVVKEAAEPMNGYLLDTNTNQLSHLVPAGISAMTQGVQPVQGQAGSVYPLQDGYLIIVLNDSGASATYDQPPEPTAPAAPASPPMRQSQSPHRPSGMSGPGMMP